ncbi:MAG: hypothetical protein A3G34_10515 [Candidatus Lindowbacteria bacterium RIFCSPLOWO2_12_FULL_62_27]|nr:MAG: hypothetical protein A3G34_10515 [Candidatus Lindowbacteria bacterium RIFCSPLOWO2_12_FULL_62_27]
MKTDAGVDFRFHTGQVEIFTKQDEQGNELRFLRGVASDDKIDRHGERFSKNALARMAETAKANLTLFGDHFHSWENTLGRAVEAAINPQGQFEVVFQLEGEEAQPKIRQLWAKLKGKTKLALSVGGRILKTFIEDTGGRQVRVLDDIELLEVSIVGIPANPRTWVEAIVKSLEKPEAGSQEPEEKQNREGNMDEIQKLKVEHETALAALKEEHERALKTAVDKADEAIARLGERQKEIDALNGRVAELGKATADATAERDRQDEQIKKLQSDLRERDAEMAKIREKADGLQAEFDRLSASLKESQAAYEDLRAKYEQAQPEVEAGKKYREDLAFEAHRLAGLVDGNGFNSDNTKRKLAALTVDDLKKEIEGLRKRVDEKFPAAGQSIHAPFDGQHAGDERQAKVRDMLNEGAPLFQDRRVNING